MKVLLLLVVSGYWALTLCAPVPVLLEDSDMFMDMDMNDSNGDNGHGGGGHSMPMWFHISEHCTILFEEWHTMTYGELVGSAIALAVLAALYEGFKVMREELLANSLANSLVITSTLQNGANKIGSQDMMVAEPMGRSKPGNLPPLPKSRKYRLSLISGAHILQAFLHMIQVWVSYMLMLAFMTYNVVICLFIGFGAAVGYWAFAWRRSRIQDNNEHCH